MAALLGVGLIAIALDPLDRTAPDPGRRAARPDPAPADVMGGGTASVATPFAERRARELSTAAIPSVDPAVPHERPIVWAELRTEREFHDAALTLARREGIGALATAFECSLQTEGEPDCKQVALLHALFELEVERGSASAVHAVRTLPYAPSPYVDSLHDVAVDLLGARIRHDRAARNALEEIAFPPAGRVAPGLRVRAVRHLARNADDEGLRRLQNLLEREPGSVLEDAVLVSLQKNPNRSSAESILAGFDRGVRPYEATAPNLNERKW